MTDNAYKKIEEFVEGNNLKYFTDRVDHSLTESLAEYGFIRNPKTDEVFYIARHYAEGTGLSDISIHKKTITVDEVRDEIRQASSGFFSYIGEDKYDALSNLQEHRLSGYILALHQYNGTLY